MSFEDDIKRLGGIERIIDGPLGALTPAQIESLETTIGFALPNDYRHFLSTFGGGVAFNEQIGFDPIKQTPEYLHAKELGLPNFLFEGAIVGTFFGSDDGLPKHLQTQWALQTYTQRLPDRALPIADDGAGNLICLIARADGSSAIYWWDHENEWDEADYEDDVGQPMPEAAKFQNVYLVGESFSDFFARLTIID